MATVSAGATRMPRFENVARPPENVAPADRSPSGGRMSLREAETRVRFPQSESSCVWFPGPVVEFVNETVWSVSASAEWFTSSKRNVSLVETPGTAVSPLWVPRITWTVLTDWRISIDVGLTASESTGPSFSLATTIPVSPGPWTASWMVRLTTALSATSRVTYIRRPAGETGSPRAGASHSDPVHVKAPRDRSSPPPPS